MYEKGNVSIREEKKYRECSIRVVTSEYKLKNMRRMISGFNCRPSGLICLMCAF